MKNLLIPFYFIHEYLLILWLDILYLLNKNPPAAWKNGTKDVLLIPGVTVYWNFMKEIGNHLNHLGYRVHIVPELGNNTYPLENSARIVSVFIIFHHLSDLIIIGHSKGGLIGTYLLANSKINSKIKLLISIATPYSGSKVSKFLKASAELIPNSPIINNVNLLKYDRNKIIAIHSRLDNHVIPHSSLHLNGAKNYELDIVGHTRILVSNKTLKLISSILKSP
jgi:triacylglycerol lipase